MFELLVPPLNTQLERVKGDKGVYDLEIRPSLVVEAVKQLLNAQVEPDVWKIEGFDRRDDCANVVAAVREKNRDDVGCIVLGRAEDDSKVRRWLATAAGVPGFIGFAVGRTCFWGPLVRWRAGKISRDEAVTEIADRYRTFAEVFEGKSYAAA
jgi:myo-inositol catabolism protein IolC